MPSSDLLNAAREGKDIYIGGGQFHRPDSPEDMKYALSRVDLAGKRHDLVDMTFLPHGIALDPRRPNLVAVCEKIGPGAALVDLDALAVIGPIAPSEDRLFYGHCAFSHDGSMLYTVETDKASSDGAIVVRNPDTLEVSGEFPSFGTNPHECLLIEDGKTMLVSNGGGDEYGSTPNVSYIDVEQRSLIRQEKLTNRTLNTGHLAVGEDGSLVVVSAPRLGAREPTLGGVSIQPQGKKLRTISSPKKVISQMQGEALSVAINDQTAVVTHPDGDMVTIWDVPTRRLIKVLSMRKPRGVSLSGDHSRFVISFGEDANIVQVDTRSLEPMNNDLYGTSMITGSHLYNWSELARPLIH